MRNNIKIKIIFFAIILFGIFGMAQGSQAATYYIAANGSDSNNGTSISTPWFHAPGMDGCSSNCASHTPSAGNSYILRGGDTFYLSWGWPWTWSGTSGSRIYVGVDKTWYTGGSWTRPKLHGGNPLSTSAVASCVVNWVNGNFLGINANYVTIDNFEFLGLCWDGSPSWGNGAYIQRFGTYDILSNLYFHGWTHTSRSSDDGTGINGYTNGTGVGNQIAFVTFDGSDSDHTSLKCVFGDGYDIHNSIFRYNSNAVVVNNGKTFHDNIIEYIYNSFDTNQHSNGLEYNSEYHDDPGTTIYNNIFRHIYSAVGVWTCSYGDDYIYNNVMYDMDTNPWVVTQGYGCTVDYTTNSGPGSTNFYNNTFVGVGMRTLDSRPYWAGTAVNNHFIDSYMPDGMSGTNTYSLSQTGSQATAQGYTAANNYAPANSSASTVNAGSSSPSSIFSTDILGTSRPQGSAWDIGAYEYSSGGGGDTTAPSAPSGLSVL